MTHKAKVWLVSTLGLAGYVAAVSSLTRWLSLPDNRGLILLIVLAVLGVGAWVFTAMFLSKRQPAPPPPQDPLSLEMDAALTQTERRLNAARVARGAALQKLPAVFVLGPRQHHKTSAVIRSGVHAELLAGDVLRGVQVMPTQSVNTWFAGQVVVAEIGVDVVQMPERFARFLARFQPARLTNALASGVQAPRAVLVCYSCEALRQPVARDATLVAARELRASLGTIAQSNGIRLPVYVLFTKADDIPGFKEFTRRFAIDETRDVLGATLPMTPEVRAAEFADRASQAYRTEMQALFHSLAVRRVDVLAREDAAEKRLSAYQFPRELRKLEPLVTDFLVELGRPSDLATNPFVRGFYFSGVREVLIGDESDAVIPAATRVSEDAGATALLGALPRPDAVAPVKSSGRRREAQWVFLDRLLSQVVLNDAAALGVTRGGTRISFFRRAAMGSIAVAAGLLIVAQLKAFSANAGLQRAVRRHTERLINEPGGSLAAGLSALDSLGSSLDVLSAHARGFTPIWYGLGLYQGDTLYGSTRAAYFSRFKPLVLDSTFAAMSAGLRSLSDTTLSDAEFSEAYERLKAYLIITDSTTLSTEELAAVLFANWPQRMILDTVDRELGHRQFKRYARELALLNPYRGGLAKDSGAIEHARSILTQSASVLRIYQAIVGDASRTIPGVSFNRDLRISTGTLSAPHVVPGAFTHDGYLFVRRAINEDVDKYFNLEPWVLGPRSSVLPQSERTAFQRLLRAKFDTQFVENWRTFVRTASVPETAVRKLDSLGVSITQLLALVNEHIGVADSTLFQRHFGPIRALGPASLREPTPSRFVPYLTQLTSLSRQMRTVAEVPPEAKASEIEKAREMVSQLASTRTEVLNSLGRQQVADLQLERLLGSPEERASQVLVRDERVTANTTARNTIDMAGLELCESYRRIAEKRPFSDSASVWASAGDLSAVFGPEGAFPNAIKGALGDVFIRQGAAISVRRDARVQPDPDASVFLTKLATIDRALYPSTGEPELRFSIRPLFPPARSLIFGNDTFRFVAQRSEAQPRREVRWALKSDRSILIGHPINRVEFWDVPEAGGWTPLSYFGGGSWQERGTNLWQFDYENGEFSGTFEVEMEREVHDLVRREVFRSRIACPTRWTR